MMQFEQRSPFEKETPLKLRELRHVVLLAEELHFARAADRAFLSQSAFSRSIAAVEEELGMRLFDRGPRFVRLTSFGERVVLRARRLLSSAMDLAQEAEQLRSGKLGDIALGSGPYSSLIITTPALVTMRRQYPDVNVRLDVADTRTLLQSLQQERISLFISDAGELPSNDQWIVEPLGEYTGALYCRAEHPLASSAELTLADLQGQLFASVHIPTPILSDLRTALGMNPGGEAKLALECESTTVLREFVLSTDAIMIAPHPTVRAELEAGHMRKLQVQEFREFEGDLPLRSALAMVWLRDRTPTASTRILADLLREQASRSLFPPSTRPCPMASAAHDQRGG